MSLLRRFQISEELIARAATNRESRFTSASQLPSRKSLTADLHDIDPVDYPNLVVRQPQDPGATCAITGPWAILGI